MEPNCSYTFKLCFRGIVKYPDCNSTHNLFGGKLLLWMDEYVAIEASSHMESNRIVTKKFSEMVFNYPVEKGKVVYIYARPIRLGKTSITMQVKARKSDLDGSNSITVARADIVYVSVDENGKPEVWNKPESHLDDLEY